MAAESALVRRAPTGTPQSGMSRRGHYVKTLEQDIVGRIRSLVFSPDATRLILFGSDGRLAALDTSTWQVVARGTLEGGAVAQAAFLADDKTIVGINTFSGSGGGDLVR